jgi:signal transduction histidine kinase/DNA-binding response OmpR family regulator
MSANNLLLYLAEALLVVVFIVVSFKAVRRPSRANLDVVWFFGAFAVLVIEGFVASALKVKLGAGPTAILDILIVSLPYLLLRLVDDFTVVPRRWMVSGLSGLALSALGFSLVPFVRFPSLVNAVLAFALITYFVVLMIYAGLTFAKAALGSTGVTRRRMQAVGAGSFCFGLAIASAGAEAAAPGARGLWTVLVDLSILGCGVLYYTGFTPPAWLRRTWQEPELRAFLGRAASLTSLPTTAAIVQELERGVRASLGVARASIGLWDSAEHILRFPSLTEESNPADRSPGIEAAFTTQQPIFEDQATLYLGIARQRGLPGLIAVPVTRGDSRIGVLAAFAERASLFAEDDVVLAQVLADQAAVVLEGRSLLDQVAQRSRELEGAVAALQKEIEERLQAEAAVLASNEALVKASQVKSDFLANMSHELRTPLNAIIGFSEVLQDCLFGPLNDRQQRHVANVLEGGRHLLHLVNDILDLSKVEAGHMELHREDLDVYALMAEAGQTMAPTAQRGDLTLEVCPSTEALLVQVDRQRFLQVLYNLLSNAVKFTPPGGVVRLSCEATPDTVVVTVSDTGIGIAPEDQARVFEEFAQVDSTLARSRQGTGLGLSLTKRLVELSGGTITLVSAPGKGSTFNFTVPRTGARPEGPGQRGEILVVEDHPPTQELLRIYLTEAGYGVHIVHESEQVMPTAIALQPVAITLDLLLGEEETWPLLRDLKIHEATRGIPVVIVSIIADGQQMGFALGAAHYLVKPVARPHLLRALEQTVARRPETCVLAVDDEPHALELLAIAMAGEPYTLITASTGAEALAVLAQRRPDVLIVDLMMKPMDGFDLIATLAAEEVTSTIPIIVLTARELTAADLARLNGYVTVTLSKSGLVRERLMRELERAIHSKRIGAQGELSRVG